MAPNTSIRGGGANDCTNTAQLVLPALAVRADAQHAGRRRGPACRGRRRSTACVQPLRAERPGRAVRPDHQVGADLAGPVDDGRDRDRLVRPDRGHHVRQLGERRRVDRLDEDVDDAAAGQPDRERVVVADAVPLQDRLAAGHHLLRELVDRALDAAAGHAADRLAVGGHRPSRPRLAAGRCARCRPRWPARTARPRAYHRAISSTTSCMAGTSGEQRRPAGASAANECPSTKSSTCGSAATMPAVSGAYPGWPRCGLTHTTRCASRGSRAICSPSSVGVAALPAVGGDHDDRAAGHPALAPAVEERLQQLAEPGAAAPVGHGRRRPRPAPVDGSRLRSSRVTRVSRVPIVNTSVPGRRRAAACANRSSASAYGCIEPLTSTSSTSRRGRTRRRAAVAAAPARRRARSIARTVRRGSSAPRCAGRCRRDDAAVSPTGSSSGDQPAYARRARSRVSRPGRGAAAPRARWRSRRATLVRVGAARAAGRSVPGTATGRSTCDRRHGAAAAARSPAKYAANARS